MAAASPTPPPPPAGRGGSGGIPPVGRGGSGRCSGRPPAKRGESGGSGGIPPAGRGGSGGIPPAQRGGSGGCGGSPRAGRASFEETLPAGRGGSRPASREPSPPPPPPRGGARKLQAGVQGGPPSPVGRGGSRELPQRGAEASGRRGAETPGSTVGRALGGHEGSDNAVTKPDWLLEGMDPNSTYVLEIRLFGNKKRVRKDFKCFCFDMTVDSDLTNYKDLLEEIVDKHPPGYFYVFSTKSKFDLKYEQ